MFNKAVRIIAACLLLNIFAAAPVAAQHNVLMYTSNSLVNNALEYFYKPFGNQFSVKSGKPYNESMDPAFMKSGPADETPQHGYFAVPLLVIGLAGILLYFTRMKD